uniref:DNA polymerase II small subunit n=1 Tax=Siphoviridae sp. cttFh17 TaxID=2826491 RepID=A0A8S5NHV7_9CAUD|nr:MAG TPA: DNA polymerase II small subunit [Siphoviridae sp. cttFh17]
MDDIEKNEFLREQLDLLKRKRTDENLEWQDVADFRSEFNGDLEHRDTVRKGSKLLYEYIDAGWVNEPVETENNSDNSELIKMRKEKIKLSDARVEYNRLIRQEARKESYVDMVKRIICENVEPMNIPVHYTLFNSSTDLLVHLTDIHTGIEIHNWKNDFNADILRQRIEKFTSDILDIRGQHDSENCYLVIGEILSGIIHNNLRLQNNMDLMEQFKYVSELISAMLSRMANHFSHIYVYTTPGNHSRISPKKEEALDGENMDVLLPFYLKARMQNVENITICDNTVEPEIAMFNIRGNNVFAAHGHKDSPSNVVQNFTMMFNIKPNIVLLGHRHTNGLTTVYDTKVIESGCCSGSDNYAISIRKVNKPEQTVSVIGENGLICLYDIQLN